MLLARSLSLENNLDIIFGVLSLILAMITAVFGILAYFQQHRAAQHQGRP